MTQTLCTTAEAKKNIESGAFLLLAGEEALLKQMPKGRWIGGTIPYFMGANGGAFSQDKVFVTELPKDVEDASIRIYGKDALHSVFQDAASNGFSFIIIPGMSPTHLAFALGAPEYPAFGTVPLIGWIAGIDLAVLGKVTPKVIDGSTGRMVEDGAVVMHASLPKNRVADIGIINIFAQGAGDVLRFPRTGFSTKDVLVNGEARNFAEYVAEKKIDTKLPLVADYAGAKINISFQSVDQQKKEVSFYAPVFENAEYKIAAPIANYTTTFTSHVPPKLEGSIVFSCNCILNYLYSNLEGKKTGQFVGPITFGEIAYQLVNQTLVYLRLINV